MSYSEAINDLTKLNYDKVDTKNMPSLKRQLKEERLWQKQQGDVKSIYKEAEFLTNLVHNKFNDCEKFKL